MYVCMYYVCRRDQCHVHPGIKVAFISFYMFTQLTSYRYPDTITDTDTPEPLKIENTTKIHLL
jgi:hypothetical protein